MNLFKLTNEYLNIANMLDDENCDEQMINDTLESMQLAIDEKADNYSKLIKHVEMETKQIEEYIDELQHKLQVRKNFIARQKENLLYAMNQLGTKEIKTDTFKISISKNGGKNPMEINEEKVPDEYMKVIYEIDKAKIREDLEKGKQLDFATLKDRGEHLTIR